MMLVLGGSGPSSKVITTSWSFSGSVCSYCMVPSKENSPGLMVSTRLVPRASGLPGQVSAEAETDTPARMQTDNATLKRSTRFFPYLLTQLLYEKPERIYWVKTNKQNQS